MSAPSTPSATKVKSPAALAHVVFRTHNFIGMVAYWKHFLGAHATWENDFLSFLTYDEEHHRIAIVGMPDSTPKAPTSVGLEHLAFSFNSLADLTDAYKQRKENGIVPTWCVNHGPTTSMYYSDPDENKIETQVDNFDTVQDSVEFMTSEAFATNPIGVDFDPEALTEKVRAGEDEKMLKARKDIGPRALDTIVWQTEKAAETWHATRETLLFED